MASSKENVEYYAQQMSGAGNIRFRAMFGEYGIYCDEKIVALVCDNQLFIKPTEAGYEFLDASNGAPPYPGAKDYLLVPEDNIKNADWLSEFVGATASELPMPKPKKK